MKVLVDTCVWSQALRHKDPVPAITERLKELIKDRINESLTSINFPTVFEVEEQAMKDASWFNEELLGNNMTDFFHSRPVEYSKKSQSFSEDDLF